MAGLVLRIPPNNVQIIDSLEFRRKENSLHLFLVKMLEILLKLPKKKKH